MSKNSSSDRQSVSSASSGASGANQGSNQNSNQNANQDSSRGVDPSGASHASSSPPRLTRHKKTELRGKWALITGATAGIGHAIAEVLAEAGVNLIITGRRQERLNSICQNLVKEFGVKVKTLQADVRDRKELEQALNAVKTEIEQLSILVNNAGLALGTDGMQSANVDDWDAMIDTNVKGLLYTTRICVPHMLKQKESHIINIGSVAGKWVYPGGGVYCATKFAVRALTEGLRLDMMGKPIRVTTIEPGMVETEFSEVRLKDSAKAKKVYEGIECLNAMDIAEGVLFCLERPAHVNIQELMIFPRDQAGVGPAYTNRQMPKV